MLRPTDITALLARHPRVIVAELTRVRGSSPRAQGTFMLVGPDEIAGTIGGGALEHLVIDRARQVIRVLPEGSRCTSALLVGDECIANGRPTGRSSTNTRPSPPRPAITT